MQRQTPAQHRREWRPRSIIRGHRSPNGGPFDGGLHWSTRDVPVTRAGASPGSAPPRADAPGPGVPRVPRGREPRQSKSILW